MFLLRVWADQGSDGEIVWRGRVQQIVSGETHSFETWSMLIELLLTMLLATEATPGERALREDETHS
jgi:hypothetical protein